MPLTTAHLERSLRVRLAETLPGVQAQLKFAPTPVRPGWRAGHFPPDTRTAAALLLLYPRAERRRHPADRPRQRAGQARRADQPARRRDRRRRDAERHGAARGGRGDRRRPGVGAHSRRADARSRRRQRLHAAPGHRRDRRAAGVRGRAGRSRGDPGSVARRPARRVAHRAGHPDPRRASRSNGPTSICSGTRCGARRPWCSASSSA